MVTGGLEWPATVITTGTWLPGVTPVGTTALIWYNPVNPGVRPAKKNEAFTPPIVKVNGFVMLARGEDGAGAPAATLALTGPRPEQYITITSPALAGGALV